MVAKLWQDAVHFWNDDRGDMSQQAIMILVMVVIVGAVLFKLGEAIAGVFNNTTDMLGQR